MRERAVHTVLLFHTVDDRRLSSFRDLGNIHPSLFEKAVSLLRNDYDVVGLDEMVTVLEETLPVRERLLAVTFDDGPKSYISNALPVMEALGVPSTCFLITDCIGDKALYWRYFFNYCVLSGFGKILAAIAGEEYGKLIPEAELLRDTRIEFSKEKNARIMKRALKEIVSEDEYREKESDLFLSGSDIVSLRSNPLVSLGIHTRTHPVMLRLSGSEIMEEISGSIDFYMQNIGSGTPMFSVPFGRLYKDYDERTVMVAGDLSLRVVLSAYGGANSLGQPLYNIRRIPVNEEMLKDGNAAFIRRLRECAGAVDYAEAERKLNEAVSSCGR